MHLKEIIKIIKIEPETDQQSFLVAGLIQAKVCRAVGRRGSIE